MFENGAPDIPSCPRSPIVREVLRRPAELAHPVALRHIRRDEDPRRIRRLFPPPLGTPSTLRPPRGDSAFSRKLTLASGQFATCEHADGRRFAADVERVVAGGGRLFGACATPFL